MQLFKKKNNWIPLSQADQLIEIVQNSAGYIYLFKHSTRCSISSMAKARLEGINFEKGTFYYLDLLQHRDISNLIASQFGIDHQSPQLIVLKDKKVIGSLSHNGISEKNIKDLVESKL